MSFLSELLTKYNAVKFGGILQPRRSTLNIVGGTVTDDPANDATVVTVGGSTTSGATVTTNSFTQPAVNSTVNVSVGTTVGPGFQSGQSVAIGGGGYYINTSTVDATHLLLLNTGSAVNQTVGGTVAANEPVAIAGSGAPLAAQARLPGQALVLSQAGADTPAGHRPVFNVLSYGAKGDGVTDDTAAIQRAANAMYPAANGELYFPAVSIIGTTSYLISGPIHLGPGAIGQVGSISVEMAPATKILCSGAVCFPAFVASNQFTDPTYGTAGPLTYCTMGASGANCWNLSYTNAGNIQLWGDGNVAHLTSSYVQPSQGAGTLVVNVDDTSAYGPPNPGVVVGTIYIQGGGLYNIEVITSTTLMLQNFIATVMSTDANTGGTVANGSHLSNIGPSIGNAPTPGFTFECFIDPVALLTPGAGSIIACSAGGVGSAGTTSAFKFDLYNDQVTSQNRIEASLYTVGTSVAGTVAVVNGSSAITFSAPKTMAKNTPIVFSSQPGVVYFIRRAITASTTARLTKHYSGVNAGAATSVQGGTTTIQGGASTIGVGAMVHAAVVYDGISAFSLYVGGVRAATAAISGPIVQQWAELFLLGMQTTATYPSASVVAGVTGSLKIAGITITSIAKYSGASFTPPTTVQAMTSRFKGSVIDFAAANRPTLIGANGVDYGKGWIKITIASQAVNPANGIPAWLQSPAGSGFNYCASPRIGDVVVDMQTQGSLGEGFYLFSALNGHFARLNVAGGSRAITFDGFSYRNTIINPNFNCGGPTRQYSWCVGALQGSQYVTIFSGYLAGGAWNIVSDVYSGIAFHGSIWCEVTGLGGLLLAGQTSPAATWDNLFFQSDLGQGAEGVAAVYLSGVDGIKGEGGFIGATFLNDAPQMIVDDCRSVALDAVWFGPVNADVGEPLIEFINQNTPVRINSVQAYGRLTAGNVTYHPINTSTNVAATAAGAPMVVGLCISFSTQPNTTYTIQAVNAGTGALTISPPYSGTSGAGATVTVNAGTPWMVETGNSGQGPLFLVQQEEFGFHIVNMIAAAGMTMLVNDFLWKLVKWTDVDGLLGAGPIAITLPLIAGYQRSYINATAQTLRFAGATGGHVDIVAGASGNLVCDGTNWLAAP